MFTMNWVEAVGCLDTQKPKTFEYLIYYPIEKPPERWETMPKNHVIRFHLLFMIIHNVFFIILCNIFGF